MHKIMSTVCWDARDALLVGFVTINAGGYCSVLDGLREAEKLKEVAMMAQPWCHCHP
jgi:hypothetical protein